MMKKITLFIFLITASFGFSQNTVTVDVADTWLGYMVVFDNPSGPTQQCGGGYCFDSSWDYFDLVIVDPPTFSNSKRMKDILDIQRDHVILINDVLKAMKPGGILFFSTNYTQFIIDTESTTFYFWKYIIVLKRRNSKW